MKDILHNGAENPKINPVKPSSPLPPHYLLSELIQHIHLFLSHVVVFRELVIACAMATDF